MPRSIPSATWRHRATPEAASCMLMMERDLLKAKGNASACHKTVIGVISQVVYYHRQLESDKTIESDNKDELDRPDQQTGTPQGGDGGACAFLGRGNRRAS